jgi:hypothetical protein
MNSIQSMTLSVQWRIDVQDTSSVFARRSPSVHLGQRIVFKTEVDVALQNDPARTLT